MLKRIAEISVKSRIKRHNLIRKKRFMNWDKINKIALVLSESENVNKSLLDTFISKTGKHIEVFYVEVKSKQPTYSDWRCFYKKELNLLKLPKNSTLQELENKSFDLVINTGNDYDLISALLTSTLNAELKCGLSSRFDCNELIISKSDDSDIVKHLENVVKYLKMIRTN
jgi:hypothetical protein